MIPRQETRPDWEGEVAVVIGRRTYRADRESALAAIGGFSALNDVTGRRAQLETPLRQFTLGKSYDTFAPMGPAIASIDGVDLDDIELRTTVSGELMQHANTRDLIFPIVDLVVYLSAGITLAPGDVIATGTPAGVGDSRVPPRYLREGDCRRDHGRGRRHALESGHARALSSSRSLTCRARSDSFAPATTPTNQRRQARCELQ